MNTFVIHAESGSAVLRDVKIEEGSTPKLEATLTHPDTEKAKSLHTVLEPIEMYVEVEGGR